MQILLRKSIDGGVHWLVPVNVANINGGSNHPQLLVRDGHVYLFWRTQAGGYRLIDISDVVPSNSSLEASK